MQNKHVQRFHNKITKLKNLLAHLAKTVADKDAKHLLLDTAKWKDVCYRMVLKRQPITLRCGSGS
jgi:hypothetical protein